MPWPRAKGKGRDSGVERFWQMQSKISQIVDEAPMGQLIREKSPGLSRQPSAITGLVQNGTLCSIDVGSWREILGDSRGGRHWGAGMGGKGVRGDHVKDVAKEIETDLCKGRIGPQNGCVRR